MFLSVLSFLFLIIVEGNEDVTPKKKEYKIQRFKKKTHLLKDTHETPNRQIQLEVKIHLIIAASCVGVCVCVLHLSIFREWFAFF